MLSVVWIAVIAAVAFWGIGVSVAVLLMLRTARLVSVATAAVSNFAARGDALMEQADAVTRRASEQVARTEMITASMDGVAATLAELNSHLTALAPAARSVADGVGVPVAKAAALVYGVGRAVGMRRRGAPPPGALPTPGGARRRAVLTARRVNGAPR